MPSLQQQSQEIAGKISELIKELQKFAPKAGAAGTGQSGTQAWDGSQGPGWTGSQSQGQDWAGSQGQGWTESQDQDWAGPQSEGRRGAAHGMQGARSAIQLPASLHSKIESASSALHSFAQMIQQQGASEWPQSERAAWNSNLTTLSKNLQPISQIAPSMKQNVDKLWHSIEEVTNALGKPGAKARKG